MYTPEQVEYMVFPRMLALSEVLWTPKNKKDENNFLNKMMTHFALMQKLNVNYSKSFYKVDIISRNGSKGIEVVLNGASSFGTIRYSLNQPGSKKRYIVASEEYTQPIWLKSSTDISVDFVPKDSSDAITTRRKIWVNHATGKKIEYLRAPSKSYPGKDGFALVDGFRATLPRINDEWTAWSGNNMEVIIDMDSSYQISTVLLGYLQDVNNWIYAPKAVQVFLSHDKKNFKEARNIVVQHREGQREVYLNFETKAARFVKIIAVNPGKIPAGKPGAGKDAWIFFDEIQIN
jgi:hexosaminidase